MVRTRRAQARFEARPASHHPTSPGFHLVLDLNDIHLCSIACSRVETGLYAASCWKWNPVSPRCVLKPTEEQLMAPIKSGNPAS